MLDTYKARLKGSRVKWTDDRPIAVSQDQEIEVLVTFLYEMKTPPDLQAQQGERMAQCLEKIARTGGIQGITDPVVFRGGIPGT